MFFIPVKGGNLKKISLIIISIFMSFAILNAEVSDVSFTDGEGNNYTLFGLLNEGKTVVLQYSETS